MSIQNSVFIPLMQIGASGILKENGIRLLGI